MTESLKTRLLRVAFNFFPAYRGTGARFTYIADDFREVRIALPLSWRTRNYVGTIFGGSMYASVDPVYMVMLINVLGKEYTVWDKAATINFKRPGHSTLFAHFALDEQEIEGIKTELIEKPSVERIYNIDLTDSDGVIHASIEKTIYIRRNEREQSVMERA
ncbi:MAG: DUF4442 domain-containing protein [Anaerolineales bacterium]|nr:DUF4442 domain-containing protein [Anaerolineales bacterium]